MSGMAGEVSDERRRWLALPGLALSNLIPLWLVVRGSLETPDLLLSYLVEVLVLLVMWLLTGSRAAYRRHGKHLRTLLVVLAIIVVSVAVRVVAEVTFDLTTVLTVLVTCGSMAAGLLFAHRQSGRGVRFGGVAWRLVLLVIGAVVGLGTAHAYDDLVRHGWEPADLGSAWSYPFGELLVRAALALDVAPLVIPALFVIVVRTLNEVLYETYDILRDGDVDRQGSRDALATMHQQRQHQHQEAAQGQRDADQGR